jgi:alpha-ribazole phosphatase
VTLWLMRHAQPCVAPGVCYGVLDMAAEAEATRQAAVALAEVLPQGLHVWVSPLQRCELLAQCLRGLRPDLTFKTDLRLGEMNFGAWEGVPWVDVPRTAMDAWTADFGEHRFGGMESVNMVLARVGAAWSDTLAATRSTGAGAALWITHAGVIRATSLVSQGVCRLNDAAEWPQDGPGYGQWRQVALHRAV